MASMPMSPSASDTAPALAPAIKAYSKAIAMIRIDRIRLNRESLFSATAVTASSTANTEHASQTIVTIVFADQSSPWAIDSTRTAPQKSWEAEEEARS